MSKDESERFSTAVVVGGADRVGGALSRSLHKAGFRVVIVDSDQQNSTILASDLDLAGETAVTATLDVSAHAGFETVLAKIVERWGSCEILINNLVSQEDIGLDVLHPNDFNRLIADQVGTVFAGMRIFGNHFKERGAGRVVNVLPDLGQSSASTTQSLSSITCGAVATLARVFAREFSPHGVTCNSVVFAGAAVDKAAHNEFAADVVTFLTTPEAGFVSGACWNLGRDP